MLNFAGRVALITGGARGLGKAYALQLAKNNATVVVNDLETGDNSSFVKEVVAEINRNGGDASASLGSVENGEQLINSVIDRHGRLDILINNAGILRDKSFVKMSEEDWCSVQKIHLNGAFSVTKAAWPFLVAQRYGKILMVSSTSGIYGNFGQANYSAAKLGLYGLCRTLAIEGKSKGIMVNSIAPTALSRMTERIIPEDLGRDLKSEYVAPFAAYLCHESCNESGGLFEVGGGWAAKVRWEKSAGVMVRKDDSPPSIDDVAANWDKVVDFSSSVSMESNEEALVEMFGNLSNMK